MCCNIARRTNVFTLHTVISLTFNQLNDTDNFVYLRTPTLTALPHYIYIHSIRITAFSSLGVPHEFYFWNEEELAGYTDFDELFVM